LQIVEVLLLLVLSGGGDVESVVETSAFFLRAVRGLHHGAPWRYACVATCDAMLLIWTLPIFENIAI
jgi:hypothetical protein